MKCPVCNKTIESGVTVSGYEHFVECGLTVLDQTGQHYHHRCLCGEFPECTTDSWDDYIRHCENTPHDWIKLFTRRALEQM